MDGDLNYLDGAQLYACSRLPITRKTKTIIEEIFILDIGEVFMTNIASSQTHQPTMMKYIGRCRVPFSTNTYHR